MSTFKHDVKPFVMFARLSMTSEDTIQTEAPYVDKVVEYELKQDECQSYCSMQPHKSDKTKLTVLEVYDSKDYLQTGHVGSEPFKKLRATSAESKTREGPPDLTMFAPKGGYLYRDEVPKVPLGEQLIWIAKLKAHPGKRGEMVDFALKHANNVHRTEGDCLSFLVLESTQDEETVVLFERYTSEEFFEKTHRTSESMKEYQANIKDLLAERQSEGYSAIRGFVDKRESI